MMEVSVWDLPNYYKTKDVKNVAKTEKVKAEVHSQGEVKMEVGVKAEVAEMKAEVKTEEAEGEEHEEDLEEDSPDVLVDEYIFF